MSDYLHIPDSIVRLAESIGWDVVLKLVECYPGMRLRVPVKMSENHILAQQLGMTGALALVKLCADEEIYISKVKAHVLACRNAKIIQEYTDGITVPELARRYDLSDRQIYNVLIKPAATDRQLSIFSEERKLVLRAKDTVLLYGAVPGSVGAD